MSNPEWGFTETTNETQSKTKTTMKKQSIIATAAVAAGLALSVATAQEATTTPVGYKTETLPEASFNLIGITLHEATTIAGSFDTVAGGDLTDNGAGLEALLDSTTGYLLEMTSGTAAGEVALLLNDGSGNDNVAGDTLSVSFTGTVAADDTYRIRPSATLESIFGSAASPNGISPGASSGVADRVWVYNGVDFEKFYVAQGFGGNQWRDADTDAVVDPATVLIPYTQGVYVVTASGGGDRSLTVTGEVKEGATTLSLNDSFNYIGIVTPVGNTLADSGLEGQVTPGASAGVADQIWVPVGSGLFAKYYLSQGFAGTQWKDADDDSNIDPATVDLTSGIIVLSRGAKDVSIQPGF